MTTLRDLEDAVRQVLLQLESMLGGDYSQPLADINYGSKSSHTLISHFPEIDLNIFTMLSGDRKVRVPIHEPEYYKELNPAALTRSFKNLECCWSLLSRNPPGNLDH